jgi:hypothetical protein
MVLALAGCSDPQIAESMARRRKNIQRTWEMRVDRESTGPERIARTRALIERQLARDARRTDENREVLRDYIDRDYRRWAEREHEYGRAIERQFAGRPERIPDTVRMILK